MQSPTIIYRVYKHTSISNKGYIGYTYKPMMVRFKEERKHSKNLKNNHKMDQALRKYPNNDQWDNKVLIDNIPTLAEAKRLEIEMIALYDTYRNGYNSTPGGDSHGPQSEETRKKIRENHPNFFGINNPFYNKHHTEKWRKKRAESNSLTWKITFPNEEIKIIKNLAQFCKENNLNKGHMCSVAQGKEKHHKRFKCSKI